jgi:hypothetical protein
MRANRCALPGAWLCVVAASGCGGMIEDPSQSGSATAAGGDSGDAGASSRAGGQTGGDGGAEGSCPDPGVVLLVHFDGPEGSTSFTDETGRHTVSVHGSAHVTTVTSEFGGGSLYLDNPGGGAYLSLASSPDWDLVNGDSTVEMWVDPVSLPSANPALLTQSPVTNDGQWTILLANDPPYAAPAGALNVQDNGNSGTSTSNSVPLGSWRHVAVVRSAGSTLLFIDGVLGAKAGPFYTQSPGDLYVGATNTSSYGSRYLWNGYLDELRITKGFARYTTNFSPPAQPFSASAVCDEPHRAREQ